MRASVRWSRTCERCSEHLKTESFGRTPPISWAGWEAREAIPDLRQALTDPYRVTVESHHGRTRELYPVRDQALGALEELGLTVELTGESEYRVVP